MGRRKTGPDLATVELVRWRDRDRCRRCGVREGQQLHHRKPRGMGGTKDPAINSPANLVLLDADCHEWIERNRAEARIDGWLVSKWGDPEQTPIVTAHGLLWLDDRGKTTPEAPTKEQTA